MERLDAYLGLGPEHTLTFKDVSSRSPHVGMLATTDTNVVKKVLPTEMA